MPVAEKTVKDKLKSIETEIAAKRDERVEAQRELDSARDAFANSDAPLAQDSPEFKAATEARGAVGAIDDRLAELQAMQVDTLKMLGKDAPASQDRPAGDRTDPRGGWNSSAIFADESIRRQLAHAATTKSRFGGIELGPVASRDALAADVTGTSNMRRGDYLGVVPQLRRMLTVLDLIPVGTMDQNTLPYTQESGVLTDAAEQTEGLAKAEGAVTFTDATATAVTIAAWTKLQKQSLADFPALQSIIDGRLRYKVERRLEDEVLAGDGSAPNMRGITATSGILTVDYDADELVADQVLRAVTKIMLANARATGIVMHPTDWQTALLAKATGDGHYYSGGPFQVTPQVLWGVPLVASPALTQGTVLVGDFEIGAQLFIREGINVLLSDSDQDDFIKNKVTLLAELRAALAVFQPTAFCTVDLTA